MQISTQARLSQAELKEAVIAYVTAKLNLPDASAGEVSFNTSGDETTATVDIISVDGGAGDKPKVTEAAKPKTTRKPAAAAAPAVEAETQEEKTDAPWEEPAGAQAVEEVAEEVVAETQVQAMPDLGDTNVQATSLKIFPDAGNSAPILKQEPVVAAKSLFANLVKPTNH